MLLRFGIMVALAAAGAAGGAVAQPGPATSPGSSAPPPSSTAAPVEGARHDPSNPTDLSGLTVAIPKTQPMVTGAYPAMGSSVAPGVVILKLTFDQPMDPEGWSYARGADGAYPSCLDRPRRLADGKTFVLLCTTAPSTAYAVQVNGDGGGFVGLGRRAAAPFELRFSTTGAESVRTIKAAMDAAGLKDDESPVEDSKPASATTASVGAPPTP